jgi:hypothetical protein
MQSLLVECFVRTSLLAAVIALVLYAMRIKAASARHAVWAGVVIVMLALPGWTVWGPKAALPVLAQQPRQAQIAFAPLWPTREISTIVRLRTRPENPARFDWNWPVAFAGVYLLVAGVFLLRLALGTMRVRRLLRDAARDDGRLTHPSCAAPVTVGWIKPSVILPVEWIEWPQARLPDGTMIKNRSMIFTIPRSPNGDIDSSNMLMVIRDRSMQELANILSNVMDRPVVNQTGIEGEFDVTMKYEGDIDPDDTPGGPLRSGIGGPSFVKALEEQLGLKIEATKAPLEVLVVDRAEKPSEN